MTGGMMFKGTPGPWTATVDQDGNNLTVVNSDGRSVVGGCGYCGSPWTDDVNPEQNAQLIAAAPELLEALTMGTQVNTPDFLDWIAARLVNVYGENPNVDFVLSLKERAEASRAAIAKALGEQK